LERGRGRGFSFSGTGKKKKRRNRAPLDPLAPEISHLELEGEKREGSSLPERKGGEGSSWGRLLSFFLIGEEVRSTGKGKASLSLLGKRKKGEEAKYSLLLSSRGKKTSGRKKEVTSTFLEGGKKKEKEGGGGLTSRLLEIDSWEGEEGKKSFSFCSPKERGGGRKKESPPSEPERGGSGEEEKKDEPAPIRRCRQKKGGIKLRQYF